MTQKLVQEKVIQACEEAIAEARSRRWSSVRELLRVADTAARSTNGNRISFSKMPAKAKTDPRFSSSLETGLRIISLFTADKPIWGVREVADSLGASRSTMHRYLITFVGLGQLEQTANRKYRRVNLDG
jgi:transcriptional regulator of acetoin/glycerol metabolism